MMHIRAGTHLRKALFALAAACTPNEVARALWRSTVDTLPADPPSLLPFPASLPNKLDFLLPSLPVCLRLTGPAG